jgi:hypothetical protein
MVSMAFRIRPGAVHQAISGDRQTVDGSVAGVELGGPLPEASTAEAGTIEIVVGGAIVRVLGRVDARSLAAVIKALRVYS